MKVTMILPYYKPEITAIVRLMDDLARDLAGYGAVVTVITGFPSRGISKEVREAFKDRPVENLAPRLRLLRTGSRTLEGRSFLRRGFLYLLKTTAFYRMARETRPDVFFIYSTPPVMGLLGALLRKKAPTLYCLQDLFPDNLVAQGKIPDKGVLHRILLQMERIIYRNNTKIVTLSSDMRDALLAKDVDSGKIFVIGNWVDTEAIRYIPREENPLFDRFGLDRKGFYVCYSGNLGHAQDIGSILECAGILRESEPDIQFLIIGSGVLEEEFQRQAVRENLINLRFFPLQPEEESARVYSIGDIGLITLKKGMEGKAMPSKTWAMMAASQPILCTTSAGTELWQILRDSGGGITSEPGEPWALGEKIRWMFHERENLPQYGKSGRAYSEKHCSRAVATRRYFDQLTEMTKGRG